MTTVLESYGRKGPALEFDTNSALLLVRFRKVGHLGSETVMPDRLFT